MWFDFGRKEGFPTIYDEHRTPVTVDVLDAGIILAAVILAVSFYVATATTKLQQNICTYTKVTISILIGAMILLGNFGQEWEIGHIVSKMPYKSGSGVEITGNVGIKIGLRSVNVTLYSNVDSSELLRNETIDYNERFHWAWDQGRFGFGPFAGNLQQEFRQAQYMGVPTPILWVVEYFVIDGEGFRFGRFYRTAGWYAHIAMWSAFPCWLLANIFFGNIIRYGGYCMALAGLFQLFANFLWLVIRNPNPLVIPFESQILTTRFGPSYWLTFSSGILCLAIALIIIIGEYKFYNQIHLFFGLNPLASTELKPIDELQLYDTLASNQASLETANPESVPLVEMRNDGEADYKIYGAVGPAPPKPVLGHFQRNRNTMVRKPQSIYARSSLATNVNPTVYHNAEDSSAIANPGVYHNTASSSTGPALPPRRR